MRENWEIKKLGQVSGFQNGFAFKSKTFKEEGIPVIRITNIQDQSIDFSKVVYVNPKDYDKDLTKYHIVKGDLLIAMSGATTGKIGINNSDNIALLNQRVGKFEPNEDLLKLFLYYFLSTKVEESLAISAGSAQPNLSTEQIKSFEIPIPPIEEQKEIVEILDQAFESIEKAKANIEKNIQNAKELFQSKLNQIFSQTGEGWEEKNIGESCEIIMGQSPKGSSYNSDGIGTPLINGPVEFGINPFSKTVMTKWTTDPKKMCKKGDLILCVRGSTTGRINIAGFDSCIGRGVAAIRYNRNQKWINYFVRNNRMKIYELGTGSTFPNISSKTISDLSFSQPISIKKQDELVETLDIIDNHIESVLLAYKEELKNLEELKKSILQKAFSGELTNKNKAA